MAVLLALLALTACKDLFGLDEPGRRPDAPPPSSGDAAGDARLCWGTELQICLTSAPTAAVTLDGPLDTAIDQRCRPEIDAYCAIAGTTITVPTAARVDVQGARPLILIATDTLAIDGVLDAASHATPPKSGPGALAAAAACNAFAAQPSMHGGGAGGSFAGSGGAGGGNDSPGNDTGGTPAAILPVSGFRAGCAGQSGGTVTGTFGLGGGGGGALALVAGISVTITGAVTASGAAGHGGQCTPAPCSKTNGDDANGGGGGGSGGMIVLDAPSVTTSSPAVVLADGGGGGEGASLSIDGVDGHEATDGLIAASGGAGAADHGGDGGAGAHAIVADGARGGQGTSSNPGGGGGGGGGAGVIQLRQATAISGGGVVSPAPR